MRQIKFRGKRTDEGGWIYGSLCNYLFNTENTTRPCIHIGNKGYIRNGFYEVYPDTIGQFTGLTDCNGKEIYEGDIIHTRNDNRLIVKYGYKEHIVRLNGVNDSFAAYGWIVENIQNGFTDFLDNECLQCKVIGNIHDNPELIPNQPTEV